MSEVKWIKIATDIFDDDKIRLIETLPAGETILVIWLKILTLAGKQNQGGFLMMNEKVAYTNEMLATIFRRELSVVQEALNTFRLFGMIEIIDDVIVVSNWERHQSLDKLEKIRENNRKRQARFKAKKRKKLESSDNYIAVTLPVTQSNTIEEDRKIELEKKIEVDEKLEVEIAEKNTTTDNHFDFNIYDYYQERIGILDGYQFQKLKDYIEIDKIKYELVKRAIDRSADNGKRNFSYINAILKGWVQNGIKTIYQQDEEQRNFESRKSSGNNQSKETNIPEWSRIHPNYKAEKEPQGMTLEEFLADEQ